MMAGRELKAKGLPPMANSFTGADTACAVFLQQFRKVFEP